MRIPLIVSSRASEEVDYPFVVLRPGKWSFSHNVTSSDVFIRTPARDVELHEEIELKEYADVRVICTKAGTEHSITVHACLSA